MKRAYFRITKKLFQDMLRLPKDVCIEGVIKDTDDYINDSFTIILNGSGLPESTEVTEGQACKRVGIIYRKDNEDLVPNLSMEFKIEPEYSIVYD